MMQAIVKRLGALYGIPKDVQNVISQMVYIYNWQRRIDRINREYASVWEPRAYMGEQSNTMLRSLVVRGIYVNLRVMYVFDIHEPGVYAHFRTLDFKDAPGLYEIYNWKDIEKGAVATLSRNYYHQRIYLDQGETAM